MQEISTGDPSGNPATWIVCLAGGVSASDALLTAGPDVTLSLVEGSKGVLTHALIATFSDANSFATASDFTNIQFTGLQSGDVVSNISVVKASGNNFNVYADLPFNAGNNAGLSPNSLTVTINDKDGSSILTTLKYLVTPAPWNVGAVVSINPLPGVTFIGKIGSFVDTNPNEAIANYSVSIDNNTNVAGNGGATGYLVQTAPGTYDVYANLQYSSSGSYQGSYIIQDITNNGTPNPSETLVGSFNANVRAGQLLWGVDQSNGQLFSVGDYALAGAEGRVTLYGQLHTTGGVIIGNDIQGFTVDATDANGRNAGYVAISKPVNGISAFTIGVIADINDPLHNSEVTLYKISGISYSLTKDNITGLAVDPITGNLIGVISHSDKSPSTLFVIDKNSLSSSTKIAKAYTLGAIVGKNELCNLSVTNARDLAFDKNGNLFVTDGVKDKLYQIDTANGEITAVVNANEDNGLGEANIEALAWDPVLNKLIGANSILNAGLPANDLVGLSIANGPNTVNVHLLQSLKDIESMAFKPQFNYLSGKNLGILIAANTEVDYFAGQGAIFLAKDVNLVNFGSTAFAGRSLVVDVSDTANSLTDRLAISAGDYITVYGTQVKYRGVVIGLIDSVENGKNGQALKITFNSNATSTSVDSLMQRITFLNTSKTLVYGDRIVSFTITDALGSIIGYTTIDLDL